MLACVRPPLASTLRRCNQVALAAKCGARAKESEQSTRVLLHFNVSMCYNEADFIAEVLFRMDQLTIERQAPVIAQYDAVVCGGGPAGWVAAVSAARNGCRTALIEKMSYLGGTPTAGLVDPISGGYHKGKRVLGGVGWEFVERLVAAGAGQVELPKGHVSFDPEYYKLLAQRMVLEAGVELYTNTVVSACQMADGRVTHVLIESKDGLQALAAGTVIDATGDGLVCRRAGMPMQVSAGGMQPMSLCFLLRNVDVTTALLRDHIHHTGLHGQSKHMGIYHALQKLAEQGEDVPQFGGPWFNSTMQEDLICVNITRAAANAADRAHLTQAECRMREDAYKLVALLRKLYPEFAKASIAEIAAQGGVRETYHIRGLYTLSGADILGGAPCADGVAFCSHPVDIHSAQDNTQTAQYFDTPCPVPYRVMVAAGFDNLIAAGRCVSCVDEAYASMRVQGTCLAIGEAAGVAAAMRRETGCAVTAVNTDDLRTRLQKQGAIV